MTYSYHQEESLLTGKNKIFKSTTGAEYCWYNKVVLSNGYMIIVVSISTL